MITSTAVLGAGAWGTALAAHLARRDDVSVTLWARDSDGAAFSRLGAPTWNPNVIAFARRDWHGNTVAVICNFAGVPITGYELDLPESGTWHEILNTDAQAYGGSGVGNLGVVHADPNGRASLVLPPLGVLWLQHGHVTHYSAPRG